MGQSGCETRSLRRTAAVIACVQPCSLQSGCFGQGRQGASNTLSLRLLQFLSPLLKVLVNRTADEFRHRSARLLRQRQQLLELLFLQEEGCALHGHIVSYRHTCVHRTIVLGTQRQGRKGFGQMEHGLRPQSWKNGLEAYSRLQSSTVHPGVIPEVHNIGAHQEVSRA